MRIGPDAILGPSAPARRVPLSLLGTALLGGVVLVLSYLLFVRTAPGQRFDDLAFEGRKATSLAVRRTAARSLSLVTLPFVVAGTALIAVVAVRRGRWSSAVVVVAGIAVTIVAARALKAGVPRPALVDLMVVGGGNTFPSGHTAAVLAVSFGGLWICVAGGDRRRVAPWAALAVLGYTTAMVGSGWHRPGDVVGGVALALCVMAVAATVDLMLARGRRHSTVAVPPAAPTAARLLALAATLVAMCSTTVVLVLRNPRPNAAHPLGAYLAAAVLCNVVAVVATLWFAISSDRAEAPGTSPDDV